MSAQGAAAGAAGRTLLEQKKWTKTRHVGELACKDAGSGVWRSTLVPASQEAKVQVFTGALCSPVRPWPKKQPTRLRGCLGRQRPEFDYPDPLNGKQDYDLFTNIQIIGKK